MKKLFRILIGGFCILAGILSAIFVIYLFSQGADIATSVIYISMLAISVSFVGLGWVIVIGGNVKEVLRDVISGMSF